MKQWLLWLLVVLALGGVLAGWGWQRYRHALDQPLHLPAPRLFQVAKGETLRSVARRLEEVGILEDAFWLRLWAWEQRVAQAIRAGEYRLEPGMTPRSLLALLLSGRAHQHRITLVEGWTVRQVLEALEAEAALEHTLKGAVPGELLDLLGLPAGNPEGRFFPDTYFFTRGTSDREILCRAFRRMEKVLAEEWPGRAPGLPLETPYQALILASVVEKESGRRDEQPRIAGVFIRRLQRGMLLQSDPTVIYGMGAAYRGNIRRRDLRTDTPYNTYVRAGLPPTPIALPGRSAIRAVLHPAAGNALYFVARGDGRHVFSPTLKEHNRAVARYQKR